MTISVRRIFLWSIALLVSGWGVACPRLSSARGLDWRLVPPNWQWIVHVDVDAIRESAAAGKVLEHFWERYPHRMEIESAAALAEANIKNDLHGITFAGVSFDPKKGVVLVHMKVNRQKLLSFVNTSPQYITHTVAEVTIHRWFDPGLNAYLYGCFLPGDVAVLSRDQELLEQIVRQAQGAASHSAEDGFYSVREGSYLQIYGRNMDRLPVQFMSPLIRRSRRLTICVGEHRDQVFIQGTFEVEGAETALNVRDALIGLLAIGKLHYADEPDSVALFEHARVFASENKTTFVWTYPAKELFKVVQRFAPWLGEK